jgi:hypothetical protein
MARYAVTCQDAAVTTGYLTVGNAVRGASTRFKLYDFVVGQGGTPADNAMFWLLQRSTTAGTLTSVTPALMELGTNASTTTAGQDATIEPTYTAATELLEIPLNQRASYRWVAAPGGEIVVPDTASAGVGFQVKSAAYTGTADVSFHFEE